MSKIKKIITATSIVAILGLTAAGIAIYVLPTLSTSKTASNVPLPTLERKAKYKVGFAQAEANSSWHQAQSNSFVKMAEDLSSACSWELVYTDAKGSAEQQVTDVNSMIAQDVDIIFLPPREEKPLIPAVMNAKKAGIPLFLIDRSVDPKAAKAGVDYVAYMSSDMANQGREVANWLLANSDGNETILELEGTVGASAANERKRGFHETISKHSGLKVVASETADFNKGKGQEVAAKLIKKHPSVTVIYAHNDEMALGAVAALEDAGRRPGIDVKVLSIDGSRGALESIMAGKISVSVETNPFFGDVACTVMKKYAAGEKIPEWVKVPGRIFTIENAARYIEFSY